MKKNIAFFMGSAAISGGTYVIFQHALFLKQQGFNVIMICMNHDEYLTLKNNTTPWHPGINDLVFISIAEAKQNYHFDLIIFTWWRTIYYLPEINAERYAYFVQSIESRFYPESDQPLRQLVDNTYQLNLPTITEAKWIKAYLAENYSTECMLVPNGIRKDLYTLEGSLAAEKSVKKLRVLIEGPLNVAFKNVEKTIQLCNQVEDIEIWLLSSSLVKNYPGVDQIFSQVPIESVPQIYRACDVLIKLSYVEGMFGPPLEMFHCGGTTLVYDVTGHDEYIIHDYNGLIAKTDDEQQVIQFLTLLRDDQTLLNKLKTGALATAKQWIDWNSSSTLFHKAVTEILNLALSTTEKNIIIELSQKYFSEYESKSNSNALTNSLLTTLKTWLKPLLYRYPRLNIIRTYVSILKFKFSSIKKL